VVRPKASHTLPTLLERSRFLRLEENSPRMRGARLPLACGYPRGMQENPQRRSLSAAAADACAGVVNWMRSHLERRRWGIVRRGYSGLTQGASAKRLARRSQAPSRPSATTAPGVDVPMSGNVFADSQRGPPCGPTKQFRRTTLTTHCARACSKWYVAGSRSGTGQRGTTNSLSSCEPELRRYRRCSLP